MRAGVGPCGNCTNPCSRVQSPSLFGFCGPRTALYSERAFLRTLGHCFGDIAIEDLPIPLFCVSTNLTEGISAVHRTGRLVTWLRATSAVPGICPPIVEQNAVYVDGGVLNNMPTDVIRDFGVASAIAVDVGTSLEGQARFDGEMGLPNIWELLWRVGTIGSDTAASRLRRDGDVVLKPEMGNIGLFDWNAHEKAIAAGRQIVLENWMRLRPLQVVFRRRNPASRRVIEIKAWQALHRGSGACCRLQALIGAATEQSDVDGTYADISQRLNVRHPIGVRSGKHHCLAVGSLRRLFHSLITPYQRRSARLASMAIGE